MINDQVRLSRSRIRARYVARLLLMVLFLLPGAKGSAVLAHHVAGAGMAGDVTLNPLRPARPGAPTVTLDTFPPMAAPGAAIPVSWDIAGGTTATNVRLLWDTISHDADNLYSNMTDPQSGGMETYYATIGSPRTSDTIYIKAKATVDGTDYYSAEEEIGRELRINSGAPGDWQDSSGDWWYGDRAFTPHYWGYEGGTTVSAFVPIGGTTEDPLYQTQRQDLTRYRIWLSNGAYEGRYQVELHFAELQATGAGQRVFNVQIEGQTVLQNFDIYAAAGGSFTANVQTFGVQVMDDELDIDFIPVNGATAVNAIRVTGIEAGAQFCENVAVIRSCDDTTYSGSNQHSAATVRLGGTNVDSGVRFLDLSIPALSRITSAGLQVYSSGEQWDETAVQIYGDNEPAAGDFCYPNSDVPDRPRTTSSVAWTINSLWHSGNPYTSPDLTDVVQEVVNQPTPYPEGTSALALMLIGQGSASFYRDVSAYDGDPSRAARLAVCYIPSWSFTPTPTPTFTPTSTPTATATATATSTPTATATATPTATATATPSPTATPHVIYLPVVIKS